MAKGRLTYRFRLSDAEFRRAWLAEYYRRPGLRIVRFGMGPAMGLLGASMLRSADRFTQIMGGVCVLFGVYYALKPFLAAHVLTRQRQRSGVASRDFAVTVDDDGVEIDDGKARARFAWSEITAAGRGGDYFWVELRGGARATVPLRAIDDPDALADRLARHTAWSGARPRAPRDDG